MSYTEVTFTIVPAEPGTEILIARLSEIGFESFEEIESGVKAYIRKEDFDEVTLKDVGLFPEGEVSISYSIRDVEDENWNSVWESSYNPVILIDKVYIRASFHPRRPDIPYEILIDPKMSFGTAHHDTTAQMIEQLLQEELTGKTVLDMGCGTAVLAILAEMLGAAGVDAIDNDGNAIENARENVIKNNCRHVNVLLGTAHEISGWYDVILANINKNILMQDMDAYASHLNPGGAILFSGFYRADLDDLRTRGHECGLSLDKETSRNNWTLARFIKQ